MPDSKNERTASYLIWLCSCFRLGRAAARTARTRRSEETSTRTERGTNVTWSERISLTELSVWAADEADAMITRYSKTIQLNMDLYWIPQWVKDTVIQQFKAASIQCRERETKAMVEEVEKRGCVFSRLG